MLRACAIRSTTNVAAPIQREEVAGERAYSKAIVPAG
jgi:hypothetical protein